MIDREWERKTDIDRERQRGTMDFPLIFILFGCNFRTYSRYRNKHFETVLMLTITPR